MVVKKYNPLNKSPKQTNPRYTVVILRRQSLARKSIVVQGGFFWYVF